MNCYTGCTNAAPSYYTRCIYPAEKNALLSTPAVHLSRYTICLHDLVPTLYPVKPLVEQ